jgi:hypothetical protein
MIWWILIGYLSFTFTVAAVALLLVLRHLRVKTPALTAKSDPVDMLVPPTTSV